MNNETVEFNKTTLDLVNRLSAIQPSILFEKSEDEKELVVNRTNNSTTIAYRLRAPANHFTFRGKELAIANFPEFYGLISVFKNPVVTQVEDENREKFVIKEGTSEINYLFSDPESIKRGPSKIDFYGGDVSVKLSPSDIKEIYKAGSLVQAEKIKFSARPGEDLTVLMTRGENDPSFTRVFPVSKTVKKSLNLSIESELFSHLPEADYLLEITESGLVRISFENNGVSLELFTAEIEEE